MSPLDIFVPQAEQSRELRTLMSSKCSKAEILSDVGTGWSWPWGGEWKKPSLERRFLVLNGWILSTWKPESCRKYDKIVWRQNQEWRTQRNPEFHDMSPNQTPKQTVGRNNIQVSSLKPSLMQLIVGGVGFSWGPCWAEPGAELTYRMPFEESSSFPALFESLEQQPQRSLSGKRCPILGWNVEMFVETVKGETVPKWFASSENWVNFWCFLRARVRVLHASPAKRMCFSIQPDFL